MKAARRPGTAGWVRVRLTAPPDPQYPNRPALTEGELILRADRIGVEEGHMLFFVGTEEVFRLDRRYFRSFAWFVDRPTFAEWLRARRAQHEHHGRPWDEDEDRRLCAEIAEGLPWERIAALHGRPPAAVRRRVSRAQRIKPNDATGA